MCIRDRGLAGPAEAHQDLPGLTRAYQGLAMLAKRPAGLRPVQQSLAELSGAVHGFPEFAGPNRA
eukprot:9369101-Pyramimonas_sp.AAC.1